MGERHTEQPSSQSEVEVVQVGIKGPRFCDDRAVGLFVRPKHMGEQHEMGECVSLTGDGKLSISGVDGQTRIDKREARDLVHILEWFIDRGNDQ